MLLNLKFEIGRIKFWERQKSSHVFNDVKQRYTQTINYNLADKKKNNEKTKPKKKIRKCYQKIQFRVMCAMMFNFRAVNKVVI